MIKLEENKTRKNLRIAMCVMYLLQILFCSLPYIHGVDKKGNFASYTVLDMLSYLGGEVPMTGAGENFKSYIWFFFLFLIIPIIGFFFCAFDKQRNLKNLVSIGCCLAGVLSILMVVNGMLSLGSMLALLVYLITCFLTTMAMFARITGK